MSQLSDKQLQCLCCTRMAYGWRDKSKEAMTQIIKTLEHTHTLYGLVVAYQHPIDQIQRHRLLKGIDLSWPPLHLYTLAIIMLFRLKLYIERKQNNIQY